MRSPVIVSALTALICVTPLAAATVSLDPTTTHQTIEGFGAHGSMRQWWVGGDHYTQAFLDLIVDDLGLTISRNQFYPDFEPQNENGDPATLDMGAFNYSGSFGAKQKPYIMALKAKADASGEPIRFVTSYWSPPAWMKTNNSTIDGGNLKTIAYGEFAEFCIATVRAYKEQCDVDLYALSIQNEPAFEEPYNSCVYDAESYRNTIKVVGPRLHAAYPDVKLFGAEDMLARWTHPESFLGPLMADPDSRAHMHALAVHGYREGVTPTPTSEAVSKWKTAARNCSSVGKPLWMTETSGYDLSWSGAMNLAEMIYAALKYGKIAAWVWWSLGEFGGGDGYSLVDEGQPTRLYYASKHFYRYIRPGAVQIESTSDNEQVLVAAFAHAQNRTLSIVAINASSATETIAVTGDNLPSSYTLYRSTSSLNCQSQGTVQAGSVSLPPSSISTLVAENYDYTPIRAQAPARAPVAPRSPVRDVRVFSLDGREAAVLPAQAVMHDGRVRWAPGAAGTWIATVTYADGTTDRRPVIAE